ncbi:hypothetical protein CPB86DRAFT_568189 [Serendipita vermifera]|nr:hypothetical protein CPB86DRAFT_568189 [Serendipita vermifera]
MIWFCMTLGVRLVGMRKDAKAGWVKAHLGLLIGYFFISGFQFSVVPKMWRHFNHITSRKWKRRSTLDVTGGGVYLLNSRDGVVTLT